MVYVIQNIQKITLKHGLDSGRYCILARHAKDEINAAHHSRKVGQPWAKLSFVRYKNLDRFFFRFVTIHACDRQTDGRTDGRTDRILIAIPRLQYMQRGKNGCIGLMYKLAAIINCTYCWRKWLETRMSFGPQFSVDYWTTFTFNLLWWCIVMVSYTGTFCVSK